MTFELQYKSILAHRNLLVYWGVNQRFENHLTRMLAQEYFIEFSLHESFRLCKNLVFQT